MGGNSIVMVGYGCFRGTTYASIEPHYALGLTGPDGQRIVGSSAQAPRDLPGALIEERAFRSVDA